jgi:uncharacterized protein YigE (DUF2233 family)
LAGWEAVAEGVSLRHDDDCDGELLRFDLQRFSASVVVPGPRRPLTAARARAEAGPQTVLAINGGFFDTAGASLGLRIVNGKIIQKLRPRVDWGVLLLLEGAASLIHSREYVADDADLGAIQVGPRLVVAGQVTQLKPQSARRTAIAVDRSGRFLTIAVTRVRVEATVLAEKLARLGAWSALMFDGGPSTQLSFAVGTRAIEIAGGYGVPDLLLLRKR